MTKTEQGKHPLRHHLTLVERGMQMIFLLAQWWEVRKVLSNILLKGIFKIRIISVGSE